MSEHPNLLKSVLIFTNPKGQHNSSLAYQKMDEVQHQTSIYVATENIPAGVAISDARWAKKLDNSTAYQAEQTRQTAEGEREQAENAREVAEGLREQGETDRDNAYSQAESARDGLYVTAESARDDLFTGSQQDRTSAYNLRENQRDDAYAAAELIREGAETDRQTTEGLRDEAEGLRVSAETSRNTAEGLRDSAETAREEAEVLRVAAEATRMGFKPMGTYNPANENKYGEWYTHEGGSYGYIWPEPSTGVPITDTTHWQQIASQGVKGDQGIQGVKGDQGTQGVKGDKGDKGDQGDQGIPGETGPRGFQGEPGANGYTPVKGTDYFDGADGSDGAKGDPGVGVPTGGSAGQVLTKSSSADFDTTWTTPSSGGPSNDTTYNDVRVLNDVARQYFSASNGSLRILMKPGASGDTFVFGTVKGYSHTTKMSWFMEFGGLLGETWSSFNVVLSPNCPFTAVRRGYDANTSSPCIVLGTADEAWPFQMVTVPQVTIAHTGIANIGTVPWTMLISTDEAGYTLADAEDIKMLSYT